VEKVILYIKSYYNQSTEGESSSREHITGV